MYLTVQKSKTNNDEKYNSFQKWFAVCFKKNISKNIYSTF